MKHSINRRIKKIKKEASLIDSYVLRPFFQEEKRISTIAQSFIDEYGGKPISKSEGIKQKKTDTLYILGCGSTINLLDKSQIEDIKKNDSIAINQWAYHEIVPTFYSLELALKDTPNSNTINKRLVSNINDKWDKYRKTTFIVKPRNLFQTETSDLINKISSAKMLYWNCYNLVPGASFWSYSLFLNIYHKLGLLKSDNFFPNRAASVVWCLGFAFKLGYKKIVLTGVDLQGNYFWLDKEPSIDTDISNKLKLHKTADPKRVNGGLTVIDIIKAWDKCIFKPSEVELFVSHKNSLLSSYLPVGGFIQ